MAYANTIIEQGSYTPTIDGATPGTTTYTSQNGYYVIIGNLIFIEFSLVITAATGTGIAQIGNLPYPNASDINWNGSVAFNGSGWPYQASRTSISAFISVGNDYIELRTCGSLIGNGTLRMANAAATMSGSIYYNI